MGTIAKSVQKSPTKKQPRVEIRCIDCDCAEPGKNGKLLGALLGVNRVLLEILQAANVAVELPCQNQKSKRRVVPL